jgi:hypothetical protein
MIGYKLFRKRKDGTLGSLFIDRKRVIPIGKYLKAGIHPTKGFAYRPGWHVCSRPNAPHLSMKNRVWFKVRLRKNIIVIHRLISQGGIWYIAKEIKVLRKV